MRWLVFRQCALHRRLFKLVFLVLWLVLGFSMDGETSFAAFQHSGVSSSETTVELVRRHLDAGEYPRVLELLPQLSRTEADAIRAELFTHQLNAGATRGAALTVLNIGDEGIRRKQLARLHANWNGVQYQSNSELPGQSRTGSASSEGLNETSLSGARGGITENDFQPLIDLITNTIAVDKWSDDGGPFSIRPYASGVYVDYSGNLQRLKVDAAKFGTWGRSNEKPVLSVNWNLDLGNRDPHWKSSLRKVSLNRLEQAASLQFSLGLPFDDTMLNLAGLTDIHYVFVDEKLGEIVIAGPAGPWQFDLIGRAINSETGRPVLQLEDFVVMLRNAVENRGKFGCSIDPRAENLAAVQELLRTTPSKGSHWKKKLRDTLGQQDIVVFGIDPRTHAARVLVEADYHMKLVGMGLEPSLLEIPNYLDRLKITHDNDPLPNDVVRWWFTTKDSDLTCNENFEMFELMGSGVRVLSESELLGQDGERIHTGQSSGAAAGFARDFTKHFAQMASRYPIYQELKNLFSLALVANLIRQQQLDQRTGRPLAFFKRTKGESQFVFPVRHAAAPQQVDSVMNERVFEYRRANSTVRNTVLAISGGVEFDASRLVSTERMKPLDVEARIGSIKGVIAPEPQVWWWD
jgi:hypothetical protein